jgi:trimeric autotransporter adhesin
MSAARSACRSIGVVLLAGAAGLAVWPANGAVADEAATPPEARSLVATASAQGIRMSYTVPDLFVVSQFIDGGGPIAQATVDTTGRAIGFGSAPYPGENGVSAPGLLTFATGVPVPPYPFYARADHPVQPTSEVKDPSGSYVLSAAADAGKAAGRAAFTGGPDKPVSQSTSDASGVLDATGAKVAAVSVNQGLSFGDGALRIASVTSRSVSTYTAGEAKPKTEAALVIEGARVGDQPVTIGPDGVHPGGQTVPVPFGEGANSLNQALAQSGMSVKTISTESPEGGVTTDALEVTIKHPVPGAANVQGTFVYTIGGSSSFIAFGAEGPGLPPLPEPISESVGVEAPPATPTAEADSVATELPSASSAASASGETFSSALGSSSPSASGSSVSGAASTGADTTATDAIGQAASPPLGAEVAPVALARDFRDSTKLLFVVLGVAGALLLASSSLWRAKGVLAAWKR